MEIKILEQSKNKVEFEVIGEDHTLCNCLVKELWNESNLNSAAYNIEHPLVSNPTMIVDVNSGTPQTALKKSVERLKKKIKSLKSEITKNIK
ncbi:DNA-directed RNA polymerase subunit L [archaeon]|nr:DNA-directed RNA polymerase subunit L [archaeon]